MSSPVEQDAWVAGKARLIDAAATGQPVEVILAVRGRLRPVAGTNGRRWRVRGPGDTILTFSAEALLAVKPLPARTAHEDDR